MLEKFNKDIIAAMKEKEQLKLTVLRMVKGAMQLESINNKKEVNDELLIDCVSKQIKLRNDSINEFEKANRGDLVDKNKEEIEILKQYLPEQMSSDEIDKVLDEVFAFVSPTSNKDMGLVMKEVTPKVKGRADMKLVSEKIKERLSTL
ncbi:MAG: GatB/YqeY domain-containing protein [Bacilli bacterium]|nr:GatB/YqeY domain-containing protein [Bacilli bacterium]